MVAFQLLVRAAHTLTVDGLCAEDDAGTLIAAVERKAGVPRAVMWLTFAGKRLDPGTSLGACGLRAGATVHLAVRGRGGGSSAIHPVGPGLEAGPGSPPRAQEMASASDPTTEAPPRLQHQRSSVGTREYFALDGLLAAVSSGAIAPLKGSWVVALAKRGGRLQRRQDLPKEAFFSAQELTRLATALGDEFGLLFVALSYRWLTRDQ